MLSYINFFRQHKNASKVFSAKIRVKFDGSFLKQDKLTFTHKTVVNIYIVYEKNF